MQVARAASLLAAALLLAGCPHPPVDSRATVKLAELDGDPAKLDAAAEEWEKKSDPVALENALLLRARRAELTPTDYDAAWRAARAAFRASDGNQGDKRRRAQFAEQGIRLADRAIALREGGVEGRYYRAALLGLSASTKTLGALDLLPKMLEEARRAAKLDERYDHAGPLRLIGALLTRAPSWPTSIGDVDEGASTMKRAVELAGDYPPNHLYYCEALKKNDKLDDARRECQLVLDAAKGQAPPPEWDGKLAAWQAEAREILK